MLIAGNWKMFKSPVEAGRFAGELRVRLEGLGGAEVAVCPPYVSLASVVEALAGSEIAVYAQSVHWADEGAFTGEISPPMLLEIGVDGAVVGHSERRQYFGDSDTSVARRARHALAAGLRVIACVGETAEEREADEAETVLRLQVEAIGDATQAHENLVLAYEPVWAIGTGKTATPEIAQEAHAFIRSILDVPILYGGSVKPENTAELMGQPDVEGALVGGASLEINSFAAICEAAARL